MRVLQVVQTLTVGGIETWLVNVMRQLDRSQHQFDFFVEASGPDPYDRQVCDMGGRIIRCVGGAAKPWRICAMLTSVLKNEGPYDVVHCHGTRAMGLHMRVAAKAGVPVRIVHSHSTQRSSKAKTKRRLRSHVSGYIAGRWMMKYMTVGLACSEEAGQSLFGSRWGVDRRMGVCLCGVDFSRMVDVRPRDAVRKELGIPCEARVVMHVGSFREAKNHPKILEMAKILLARRGDIFIVLVGSGRSFDSVKAEVSQFGLDGRVILTGPRQDIPDLLCAADAFVFPSLYEGMPLSLVEAQAAGLPCVTSDVIPSVAYVMPELIRSLAPDAPGEQWAEMAEKALAQNRLKPRACLVRLKQSEFSIEHSVRTLLEVYRTNHPPRREIAQDHVQPHNLVPPSNQGT